MLGARVHKHLGLHPNVGTLAPLSSGQWLHDHTGLHRQCGNRTARHNLTVPLCNAVDLFLQRIGHLAHVAFARSDKL